MRSFVQVTGLTVALIALLAGCNGEDAGGSKNATVKPAQEKKQVAAPIGDSYSVRGEVVTADAERGELTIHHETIANFIGPGGSPEAMHAMEMTFPVVDSVDLSGVETGSPVQFTLVVNWQARKTAVVTELEGLPEGTQLELEGH